MVVMLVSFDIKVGGVEDCTRFDVGKFYSSFFICLYQLPRLSLGVDSQ